MKDKYNKDEGFFIKAGWYAEEDKEKQIEQMAKIIKNAFIVYFGANDLVDPEDFPYQAKDLAKELLEHYQPKLPEDSIVLSRASWYEQQNFKYELGFGTGKQIARKETAEKILRKGKEFYNSKKDKELAFNLFAMWIESQFNVEIKE